MGPLYTSEILSSEESKMAIMYEPPCLSRRRFKKKMIVSNYNCKKKLSKNIITKKKKMKRGEESFAQ